MHTHKHTSAKRSYINYSPIDPRALQFPLRQCGTFRSHLACGPLRHLHIHTPLLFQEWESSQSSVGLQNSYRPTRQWKPACPYTDIEQGPKAQGSAVRKQWQAHQMTQFCCSLDEGSLWLTRAIPCGASHTKATYPTFASQAACRQGPRLLEWMKGRWTDRWGTGGQGSHSQGAEA